MKMIQGKVSTLLLLITIIYVGGSNSQFATWPGGPAVPRPLCLSQFSLVNNACQFLPLTPLPPPGPAPRPVPTFSPAPASRPVPTFSPAPASRPVPTFSPAPGPAPAPGLVPMLSPAPAPGASLGYTQTPAEEECCRWMKAVDSECVCSLLARLPTFLARPIHQYTTLAHATCSVTFTCGSSARYRENDHQKSPHSP